MKVLASVAPEAQWQNSQPQFAVKRVQSGAIVPNGEQLLSDSQTTQQLSDLLSRYPQAEFAIAYQAPEQMLGQLLANGIVPQQAAVTWCRQTRALLQLQQQQRKRLKLFNLAFVAGNPAPLPAWLHYQPGSAVPAETDSIYTLLAAQLLRQHTECATLLPLLQASSLPLQTQHDYMFNLDALQQQAGDKTQLDAARAQADTLAQQVDAAQTKNNTLAQQLSATSDERDILLLQLQQVQEELEQYYLKWLSVEQKNSHSDTTRDKQQQRELSKLESQLRKTKARAAGAEHQLQLLQQELNAVKGSALWKTAAPVRVLTRLVKKTDKAKQKLQQEAALIITSEYFDIDWYLARYPDVAAGNINPAEHYLKFGAAEGRMPGPLFDGNWYLQRYPDVATSGINPLLHFIKFGQLEGRSVSPKLLADNSTRGE